MPPRDGAIMRSPTAQQVLQVCTRFREQYAGGTELQPACELAFQAVKKAYRLRTETTVRDACVRRLGLNHTRDFYELLRAWMGGDARPLLRLLKEHSHPRDHGDIDSCLAMPVPPKHESSAAVARQDEPETVSFRLHAQDARSLRAVAAYEGVSQGELLAALVTAALRERVEVGERRLVIKEQPATKSIPYTCGRCGSQVWGPRGLNILCGGCGEALGSDGDGR